MTTENQVDQSQTTPEAKSEEKQYSAVEQRALEQGWKPKDQFQGEEADFIDAGEFVRRGELFSKIEKQSKEVKQLREALEAFKMHHSKVKEVEYDRALKALDTARKQALSEGDTDKFFALEEQMEAVKTEKAVVEQEAKVPVVQEPSVPPQLESWMQKNSWYQTNRAMTALADRLGAEFKARGFTLDQALHQIDAEVRKEFPDKFASRVRPPAPEGSTRSGSPKTDNFVMSDEERSIMQKIVKTGVISKEDYIKELKRVKGN